MEKKINFNDHLYSLKNITYNTTDDNSISFIEKIFSIIEELYIYCHLKNYSNEESKEEKTIALIIMIILVTIFSFTMIKVALVSIYFFLITVGCNIGKFFILLFKNKFQINLVSEFKFACFYLGKILKKLYTYNFHAYDNKLLGVGLVTIYLVFLTFNIMFTTEYLVIENNIVPKEDVPESFEYVKVLKIILFELGIFMELLCCTFYITREIKNQFNLVFSFFIGLNLIVIFTVIIKSYLPDSDDDNPRKFTNLIFLTIFTVFFSISAIKVFRYDLNCNELF